MKKHLKVIVFGKVQGVGFRFCAIQIALELGLTGFVKNQGEQVCAEAEGEVENLKKFLKWCHQGPEDAVIEKVEYESSETLQNFTEFKGE